MRKLVIAMLGITGIALFGGATLASDNIPLGMLKAPLAFQRQGEAATYTLHSVTEGKQNTIISLTTRISSQSTSYTRRAFQCEAGKMITLASAETYEGLASSKPDPQWSDLVPGSSAYFTGQYACKAAGRKFGA